MNKYLKNVIQLVLLLCFTFVIFHYIFLPVKISGDSMYPTLKDSEMAIMDALHVKDDDIERFDIIVIDSHYLEKYIVKRVIGLPGEKIEYKDDKLYINDQYYPESFLDQDYINQIKADKGLSVFTDDFVIQLNDDELFVLGDNRINSLDSRVLGPVSYQDVVAKDGMIWYPLNEMKWMDK